MKGIGNEEFQELTEGMTKEEMIKYLLHELDCPDEYGLDKEKDCASTCEDCCKNAIEKAFEKLKPENENRQYKASEIMAMIENEELKPGDVLIDKDGDKVDIKLLTLYELNKYAPYKKDKLILVEFIDAIKEFVNGETIICLIDDCEFEFIGSETNNLATSIHLTPQEILHGTWYVKKKVEGGNI